MQLVFDHITNGNEVYMDCLQTLIGYTRRESMIDLGCHKAAHTPLLGFERRRYVDLIENKLDFPSEQQYFVQGDILEIPLHVYYNVSFAQDVIEHLTIPNGTKLIHIMDVISDKQIYFTPLDDLFGMDFETNNPESHRSLWKPQMLEYMLPNKFIFLTFPRYHSVWNGGAFFFMSCKDGIDKEFKRIKKDIKQYEWSNKTKNA